MERSNITWEEVQQFEELIPLAEKRWLEFEDKLPDNYVSPLKDHQLLAESLLCYFGRANRNQTLMCADLARLLLFSTSYYSIVTNNPCL